MIIYGKTPEQIAQQKICDHNWHGPCMDTVSRYYKCTKCFCLDRDMKEPQNIAVGYPAEQVAGGCGTVAGYIAGQGSGEKEKGRIHMYEKCIYILWGLAVGWFSFLLIFLFIGGDRLTDLFYRSPTWGYVILGITVGIILLLVVTVIGLEILDKYKGP